MAAQEQVLGAVAGVSTSRRPWNKERRRDSAITSYSLEVEWVYVMAADGRAA